VSKSQTAVAPLASQHDDIEAMPGLRIAQRLADQRRTRRELNLLDQQFHSARMRHFIQEIRHLGKLWLPTPSSL